MGPFDLTDRRACGHPNGHCLACGQSTPSLRAEYCSVACRYQGQKAQRWEQYEPRVGSHHGGQRTRNSPNENRSGRSILDGNIVDGNVATKEEIR